MGSWSHSLLYDLQHPALLGRNGVRTVSKNPPGGVIYCTLICDARLIISDSRQISPGLRHLLLRMLDKDPVRRATILEIRENPWLNEGCKTPLTLEE